MGETKIAVTQSSMPPLDEYIAEIQDIWDTCLLTNFGNHYQRLCENLKETLCVPKISLFANGHLALEAAIASFRLTGEVITTPFTFASTTHAIVRNGLTPVFCDIDERTYCIDPKKIEALITPRTTAIVPVHVYGLICDTKTIQSIAKKHNLKVIYDGAHAFGIKKNGIGIGSFGDATMFSFHATKVFHTIEGGAVTYREDGLEKILHQIQNFGFFDTEKAELAGGNAKMNEFQAAMGLCNLRYLQRTIIARKAVVEHYVKRLSDVKGVILPPEQANVEKNYAYFPIRIDPLLFGETRDEVKVRLANHNIFTRKYFYPLTSAFQCYKDMFDPGHTPIAEKIAASILALPLYEKLTISEVDRICDVILEGKV